MGLNLRLPFGIVFPMVEDIRAGYSVCRSGSAVYVNSQEINRNLVWNLGMLFFGLIMFIAGRKKTNNTRFADLAPGDRSAKELK